MRLLHTETRGLEEFFDDAIPPYAILSHTWGPNELTFRDLAGLEQVPPNVKIDGCCLQAMSDGHEWIWIDTICIDKSSSAELSEAINSMFLWYKNAKVCYVYLSDVSAAPTDENFADYFDNPDLEFSRSRWFTRGWTLQELIAPERLIFFTKEWSFIGSKIFVMPHNKNRDGMCLKAVGRITGVWYLALAFPHLVDRATVAEKMAWASKRRTSRKEDMAYCLMGLFGINMPMLYGEGDRAFQRLQEEIIRKSDDESIFAWGYGPAQEGSIGYELFAPSPARFSGCLGLQNRRNAGVVGELAATHYSMTNRGLLIERPLLVLPPPFDSVLIPLRCGVANEHPHDPDRDDDAILGLVADGNPVRNGSLTLRRSTKPLNIPHSLFASFATAPGQLYIRDLHLQSLGKKRLPLLDLTVRQPGAHAHQYVKPRVLEVYPASVDIESSPMLAPNVDFPVIRVLTDRGGLVKGVEIMLRVELANQGTYLMYLCVESMPSPFGKDLLLVNYGIKGETSGLSLLQQLLEAPADILGPLKHRAWPKEASGGGVHLDLDKAGSDYVHNVSLYGDWWFDSGNATPDAIPLLTIHCRGNDGQSFD